LGKSIQIYINRMKKQTLTIPEWVFLDAANHTGNELEGRDVLLHVRTHTMLEFFNQTDDLIQLNKNVKQKQFYFKNKFGITENYRVAVHYSLTEFFDTDTDAVIDGAIEFFKKWMNWMDSTINQEETSKHN